MADPFSIIASSIGVIDVCVRLGTFLLEAKRGSDAIDEKLDGLIAEIYALKSVSNLIRESLEGGDFSDGDIPRRDKEDVLTLWSATLNALQDGHKTLAELEDIVKKVSGEGGTSTGERLRKYFRKLWKEDRIQELWAKLARSQSLLQMMLTGINITHTRKSAQSFAELSSSMRVLRETLQAQIASLQDTMEATTSNARADINSQKVLATARTIHQLASPNMYFMIPQAVRPTFTGRQNALDDLRSAFATPGVANATRRFVIYGLGGSGKSQFCCKFAQDNRQEFWGVFYIDASTSASAQSSYADIAESARIEPNERSVKHWLSNQKMPWLMIIDNVEDRENSRPPDSYIPECETGMAILTTRDQSLKTHGNFGPHYFHFQGLEDDESIDLLLTCAGQRAPFMPAATNFARDICKQLGNLPLALVQAGKAILKGRCTLQTCLGYFERSWTSVRETIQERKGNRPRRSSFTANEKVYSTYEMLVSAASDDAIELLKLFSFMHPQRLDFEILVQAVLNPQIEKAAEEKASKNKAGAINGSRTSWRQSGRDLARRFYTVMIKLGHREVLPNVFRALNGLERDDIEFRLREALSELTSIALVDYVASDDSYSMHPLIHWWIHCRMTLAEQAVWCQSACNILANAILLPPLGNGEDQAQLRRHMLAHIESVRLQETKIQKKVQSKQRERKRPWPVLQRSLRPAEIRQYAKYGLVYAESGHWKPASELFTIVDSFLCQNIGLGHPTAIRARLFLSESHGWLGEENEAANLQYELLEACISLRGEQDVETLNVMDRLAVSLWSQGRFEKAKYHQQKALEGFQNVHPTGHTDTMRAMTNLGRVVGKLADFDEAVRLHIAALEGLSKDPSRGKQDSEILAVKENLAMAKYDRHRYGHPQSDDLTLAEVLQSEVVSQRVEKLGKEHPLTLWAYCNFARIKASLGATEEAEDLIRQRLPIAERNLGEDHVGTLFGKIQLGRVLVLRNKFDEAEAILTHVLQDYEKNRRDHPDQLAATAFLVECYQKQGKHREAQPLKEKTIESIKRLFGEGSAWEKYLLAEDSPQPTHEGTQPQPVTQPG